VPTLLLLCLLACSRHEPTQPAGLAGLAFGDPPGAGLVPVPAVLPDALAGDLAYFTRTGPAAPFRGVALADPVFGFYRGRLFSVLVRLADPAAAPGLHRDLTAAFGATLCRDRARGRSCLWRLAEVDLVLEQGDDQPVRLLARQRGLAGPVQAWRGQQPLLERNPGQP
jgi:hypothetical protein